MIPIASNILLLITCCYLYYSNRLLCNMLQNANMRCKEYRSLITVYKQADYKEDKPTAYFGEYI